MARDQKIYETNNYGGGVLVDRTTELPVGFTAQGVDQYMVIPVADPLTGGSSFSGATSELKLSSGITDLTGGVSGVNLAAPGPIGGTTPSPVYASPSIAKGPAAVTSFAGTIARSGTTLTFSSSSDAILAGYSATAPVVGVTVIHPTGPVTMIILAWLSSLTATVDSSGTLAAQTPTSIQWPIEVLTNSAGVLSRAEIASGDTFRSGTWRSTAATMLEFVAPDPINSPFSFKQASFVNPGGNPRKDYAVCFGYNVDCAAIASNPADHAFGTWLECFYGPPSGNEQVEYYLQGKALNGSSLRPFGVVFNSQTANTQVSIDSDTLYINTTNAKTVDMAIGASLIISTGRATGGPTRIQLRALNADGNTVYLVHDPSYGVYLDNRDLTDAKGLAVWNSGTQTSDAFQVKKGGITVMDVTADGGAYFASTVGIATPTPAAGTKLDVAGLTRSGGYTIGTLPTGVNGAECYVTDQLTAPAAKGAAPTAGGSVICKLIYNGSAWVGV